MFMCIKICIYTNKCNHFLSGEALGRELGDESTETLSWLRYVIVSN